MGLRTCRFLSVVLLAGAALVGCNNTPDKPKVFGKGPELPGANNTLVNGQNPNSKFPIAPGGNTNNPQFGGYQPNSPLGSGPGNPLPSGQSFAPSGGLNGIGNAPPKLPQLPNDLPPLPSNNNGRITVPAGGSTDFGIIGGPALPSSPTPIRIPDGKFPGQ